MALFIVTSWKEIKILQIYIGRQKIKYRCFEIIKDLIKVSPVLIQKGHDSNEVVAPEEVLAQTENLNFHNMF